jgi:hypothetical protein
VRKTGKRKYEHRGMITRTIATTTGDVTYFDTAEKKNSIAKVTLNGKMSAEAFLNRVQIENGIVLMVDNVIVDQKLYAISVEDFVKYATVIE